MPSKKEKSVSGVKKVDPAVKETPSPEASKSTVVCTIEGHDFVNEKLAGFAMQARECKRGCRKNRNTKLCLLVCILINFLKSYDKKVHDGELIRKIWGPFSFGGASNCNHHCYLSMSQEQRDCETSVDWMLLACDPRYDHCHPIYNVDVRVHTMIDNWDCFKANAATYVLLDYYIKYSIRNLSPIVVADWLIDCLGEIDRDLATGHIEEPEKHLDEIPIEQKISYIDGKICIFLMDDGYVEATGDYKFCKMPEEYRDYRKAWVAIGREHIENKRSLLAITEFLERCGCDILKKLMKQNPASAEN